MFTATLTLSLQGVESFDWESDVSSLHVALVKDVPSLTKMFLDNAFEFVADFRTLVSSYLDERPQLRTCPEFLSSSEEAGIVVSEALEAAKFALSRAPRNPSEGLMSAEDVKDVVRCIVG